MSFIIIPNNASYKNEFIWNENGTHIELDYFPIKTNLIIAIGSNNSRKSRFYRHLLNNTEFLITSEPLINILNSIKYYINNIINGKTSDRFIQIRFLQPNQKTDPFQRNQLDFENIINLFKYADPQTRHTILINEKHLNEIIGKIDIVINNISKDMTINLENELNKLYLSLKVISEWTILLKKRYNLPEYLDFFYHGAHNPREIELQQNDQLLSELISKYILIKKTFISPPKTYIPTLRGSVILKESNNAKNYISINSSVYESTVRSNYDLNKEIYIFTGLNLYSIIKQLRNSRREIRKDFENYENFLRDSIFSGNQIDIVSIEGEEVIHVYIGGESDRELHNIGDGIQAIIILLYPIFTAKEGSWIFIEEPELHLHPGLQSLFLNTLLTNENILKKGLKIFITTHSNHLIDNLLINDSKCSIISFSKSSIADENKSILKEELSPDANLLNLLGVNNSSVLLSNVTIWVEGVTDRKYIKAFLDSYIKDNNLSPIFEGFHYEFVEYSGSNINHYLFEVENEEGLNKIKALSISNRIFLLSDRDENKEEKHNNYKNINSTYFIYTNTGAIEIENILSVSIINFILKDLLNFDYNFKLNYFDYENVRLGKYLARIIKKSRLPVPALEGPSGSLTTYYKNRFAEYVSEQIGLGTITWNHIEECNHARDLIQKLYQFIKSNNNIK